MTFGLSVRVAVNVSPVETCENCQADDVVLKRTAGTRLESETEALGLEVLGLRPYEKNGIVQEIHLGDGIRVWSADIHGGDTVVDERAVVHCQ